MSHKCHKIDNETRQTFLHQDLDCRRKKHLIKFSFELYILKFSGQKCGFGNRFENEYAHIEYSDNHIS